METPFSHDIRAASVDSKRARTRAEKYYGFRHVKPGQLHQPHYRLLDLSGRIRIAGGGLCLSQSTHSNITPIQSFTPKILYEEAQWWPRPPKYHHRCTDKLDKRGGCMAYENRKVGQRDIERMVRRVVGPEQEWKDDQEGCTHGDSASTCGICLGRETDYESAAWQEEIEIAQTLNSHAEVDGQAAGKEVLARWDHLRKEQLNHDEWSFASSSDEPSNSGSEKEESDATSEWEFVDP